MMLLSHWQNSKDYRKSPLKISVLIVPVRRFFLPYRQPLEQITSVCILIRKETLYHTHVQRLSKPARACDQRNLIRIFPPFPDEICFVNVKICCVLTVSKS